MKMLSRIRLLGLAVWRSQALKYAVVCLVGVLIVGFLDENSAWSHVKNLRRIRELTEETARYDAEYERNQAQIRALQQSPKAMERIARERYFMKADNEDIFVLSDDERTPQSLVSHETAQ